MKKFKNLFQRSVRSKLKNQEIHKNLVRNCLQCILTETEYTFSSQELNYTNTTQNIPYKEYILATELARQKQENQGKKVELHIICSGHTQNFQKPSGGPSGPARPSMEAQTYSEKGLTVTMHSLLDKRVKLT